MRKTAALSDAHTWSSNYSILRRWQPLISKYNATNCDLRLASLGQGCGQDVYVFVSLIQTLPLRPRRCLWLLEVGTSVGERVRSNGLFCRPDHMRRKHKPRCDEKPSWRQCIQIRLNAWARTAHFHGNKLVTAVGGLNPEINWQSLVSRLTVATCLLVF